MKRIGREGLLVSMMRGETRRELVYRPESRPAPNPLVRVGSEDPEQQLGSSVASSVALFFSHEDPSSISRWTNLVCSLAYLQILLLGAGDPRNPPALIALLVAVAKFLVFPAWYVVSESAQ